MKIDLKRIDNDFKMEAVNETGNTIILDGSPKVGGHNQGMRPMQVLLAGVGACSAIDVISILKKQRQTIDDLQISVEGDRQKDAEPSLYENVKVVYHVKGDVDEAKLKRALELSFTKYCSVSKTLEGAGAEITWDYVLNGE